ncbi:MAG: DUF3592 domain-containing protein [Candidatus Fermentibacteraceae bacterium]
MPGKPRRAIIRPWNMLLMVGMLILAVLAGRISDRIPALPPEMASCLLLMAGTVTLAVLAKELLLYVRMRGWPGAGGVVIRSEIVRIDDGESIIYRPLVQCSYQVDGTGHTTEALHPGYENHSSSFESRWRKLVESYPVGTEVTVTYNPQNPSEAYLRKTSPVTAVGALFFTLALLALFLLAP